MAKKTRAQRKKDNLRNVQGSPAQDARELDSLADEAPQDAVEDAVEAQASSEPSESLVPEPAASVKSEPSAKAVAREAKDQQKRIERAKKATKRAEAKKARGGKRRGPKFIWTFVDYLKAVRQEMKRVTWPTRREVGRMTVVVLVALVFFGVLIFVVDSVFTPLLYMFSGLGG